MWRKGFTKYVSQINSDSFRIQAVKFNFPGADLLVFNLYFMVDPHNNLFNDEDINCDFEDYTIGQHYS